MELFKRILLTLFPENITNQPINPISMFVSFISAKQFFSVINRKIVENYKLNLFDISLDSFEVKVGFGEQPNIKVKDIDFYYSYGVVANFNGYRFLSPANVGTCIAMVCAVYMKDVFAKYKHEDFVNFLLTVYLLGFVFISRLKVFPYDDDQENYKWFIDVFMDFYKMVGEQTGEKIEQSKLDSIKKDMLQNIQVFFMLFHYYKRMNNLLYDRLLSEKEFYNWLYYDELKKGTYKQNLIDFVDNFIAYSRAPYFSNTEKKIMNLVFPADILLRYITDHTDANLIIDYVISPIYDRDKLDKYFTSFLKSDAQLEDFIMYITDFNLYKDKYFSGIKKFMINKFRDNDGFKEDDEIEEFMSTIGDDDDIENVKVPERIKKESALMEKFINFYMTFIGGFWISRGDNYYLRLFKRNILQELLKFTDIVGLKQDVLYFYGGLLYNYSKNVFYYKYAFENVRAGKEKFNLPFRSTFREVYSNMFILKLFDEDFIGNLLQDTNQKDIKIYLQNKDLLNQFRQDFGTQISSIVSKDDENIVLNVYGEITGLLKDIKNFDKILASNFDKKQISNLKESIYTIDFWMWKSMIKYISNGKFNLGDKYSDFSILGVLSFFRDSIFGFCVYYAYLLRYQNAEDIDLRLVALKKVYILDIIGLSEEYFDYFSDIIDNLVEDYDELLLNWTNIDNNEKYFKIGLDDWLVFIDDKSDEKIVADISGEDVIWFRGYLKNINYYNKRFLIDKNY